MISFGQALRTEVRSQSTWIWVSVQDWVDCANSLKGQGLVRCEWLTATHLSEQLFQVTFCVSDEFAGNKVVVVAETQDQIDSIEQVYSIARFHEREASQMLGLSFNNSTDNSHGFNTEFSGYPLRRDYVLTERVSHDWPGQVDPEKVTKRRPALAPGVREEWLS